MHGCASSEKIESWEINAAAWLKTIEEQAIASRSITSPAIFNTIRKLNPSKVLDLGCGEGWLSWQLNQVGIETVGINCTADLIKRARTREGHYYIQSYEEIIDGAEIPDGPYEAIIFNFCLYLDADTEKILQAVRKSLVYDQWVVIQTLHPFACIESEFKYQNQWLDDSWKGLKGAFSSPHKWFYRTLKGWVRAINRSGYKIEGIKEPLLEEKNMPASIIFMLTAEHD